MAVRYLVGYFTGIPGAMHGIGSSTEELPDYEYPGIAPRSQGVVCNISDGSYTTLVVMVLVLPGRARGRTRLNSGMIGIWRYAKATRLPGFRILMPGYVVLL